MTDYLKGIVLGTLIFTVICIASAYVFYFVGMVVSLVAGGILYTPPQVIASIFAWLGVLFAAYACTLFFKYALNHAANEMNEEDGK